MLQQIEYDTRLVTDEGSAYRKLQRSDFKSHKTIKHKSGIYVRGQIHTNTIENYFSTLKRCLHGTYQHVGSRHLKRYVGEFDFRYNNRMALGISDTERTDRALQGISCKRLTYRRTDTKAKEKA